MVPRRRFERPTCRLGGGCSIQLSYRSKVKSCRIIAMLFCLLQIFNFLCETTLGFLCFRECIRASGLGFARSIWAVQGWSSHLASNQVHNMTKCFLRSRHQLAVNLI
jgi:hypothetical protein